MNDLSSPSASAGAVVRHEATVLTEAADAVSPDIGRLSWSVLWVSIGTIAAFLIWAALMTIQGGVTAPGKVTVKTKTKAVQHTTGGRILKVLVSDGEIVEMDQPLIQFDAVDARTTLAVTENNYWQSLIKFARLSAEVNDSKTFSLPAEIANDQHPEAMHIYRGQLNLFNAQNRLHKSRLELLDQTIPILEDEIRAHESRLSAVGEQIVLINDEISGVKDLYLKGLTEKSRYLSPQRARVDLHGLKGELEANIAQKRNEITTRRLQKLEAEHQRRSDLVREFEETRISLSVLRAKLAEAKERVNNLTLRAPQKGFVSDIKALGSGYVVGSGQDLLRIVPMGEEYVIQAKLNPVDVDVVYAGAPARLRFSSFDVRNSPTVEGQVTYVAPDVVSDPGGEAQFYEMVVSFDVAKLPRELAKLVTPGMPISVMITTADRSVLSYLLAPLSSMLETTMREN